MPYSPPNFDTERGSASAYQANNGGPAAQATNSRFPDEEFAQFLSQMNSDSCSLPSSPKNPGANASAGTRYNGLSVLRKIGKTIYLSSNDTLDHEVQKHFGFSDVLGDAMLVIIGAMTPEERLDIRQNESSSEALWPKLVELHELAQDQCVFSRLEEVLDLLEGEDGDEDDHDGDDDNDEEAGEENDEEGPEIIEPE